jgi:transcriptional regulator with XRE-family HTH domain
MRSGRVGECLRRARERAGLTQAEVARAWRVRSAQSVSNIERGVAPLPVRRAEWVQRHLGVDLRPIMVREYREWLYE